MRYCNLCIIGSGPAGQKAAIQAAKLGKDVIIVERMEFVGGVAINTGTIPSKALREAVLAMTQVNRQQGVACEAAPDRRDLIRRLTESCQRVIRAEIDLVRRHFTSNGVVQIHGHASFVDANTVKVDSRGGEERIVADKFLIGVGTTPAKPPNIPFDDVNIITSDELLKLQYLPRSMIIVGGGVIGTEYASMLQPLGVRVTLVEGRPRTLEFVDSEIGEALQYHLRQGGMTLRLGEKVVTIRKIDPPPGARTGNNAMAEAVLESGKTLRADCLLYCIGRQGATDGLNLAAAGLEADNRGRIMVNEHYQTAVPHIYAAGDVIGFPALASTSMEQGRIAACHMFGERAESVPRLLPYGIYAIPELSMVGWTEEQLTKEGIPYVAGIANYREIARGQLLGDELGMLKVLIHEETRAVLGVHALGTHATELIHIGQAVMAFNGTADYFVNTVFNYPTLAECYKVAALNGINKLRSI